LFVKDTEYFLSYEDFPWFKDARVSEILEVELHHGFHLHWPRLDVDLDVASLKNPEQFPLISWPDIFAHGQSVARRNGLTENDVAAEIRRHRESKRRRS